MKRTEISNESIILKKKMKTVIYGERGIPVIAFPSGSTQSTYLETVGVIDVLKEYIDKDLLQIFCVETIDEDGWSDVFGKYEQREANIENYYNYIIEEIIPLIAEYNDNIPLAIGFGVGALNAASVVLRRPDLFAGLLGCSGNYDGSYYFKGHCSDIIYNNSPALFMENMPYDHKYIKMYNERKIALCVGQSNFEKESQRTANMLKCSFNDRGINAWVDFWGHDVTPEWDWWKKQLIYFIPWLLNIKK